jgi:formate hydrogenlyase subunit 6/NADH:ubiquinone oxidoreductase subunit I
VAIILFKKRWICRFACPAGVVCDLASARGRKTRTRLRIPLNKYLALMALGLLLAGAPILVIADPMNIFFMAMEGFRTGFGVQALLKISGLFVLVVFSLLFPHLWCASLCPLGGLQLVLYDLRKYFTGFRKDPVPAPEGRRIFLSGLAGALGGVFIPRLLPTGREQVIRPPFSLAEDQLNLVCARCGNCSSVCPTRVIHPSLDLHQPERLLTPVVRFSDSYCLPECNACGTACPSGAIQSFPVHKKGSFIMGHAVISPDQCYLTVGRECSMCKNACAYDAVHIPTSGTGSSHIPVIDTARCTGCGACKVICPPQVIDIMA